MSDIPVTVHYPDSELSDSSADIMWIAGIQTIRTSGVKRIEAALLAKTQGHDGTIDELAGLFHQNDTFTLDGQWAAEDDGFSFADHRTRETEFRITADQFVGVAAHV